MIRTKPLRQPVELGDGTRIYIGRRYPRGVKDGALWRERIHDLGPSLELHRAVLHEGLPLEEYERRFRRQLEDSPAIDLVRALARRSRQGETITLLCDHPKAISDERCHRFIVKDAIEREERRLDSP